MDIHQKITEFLRVMSSPGIDERNAESICRTRTIVSALLGLAALIMLIMNLINHSMVMAYSSIALVVGFSLSGLASGTLKNSVLSGAIIAVLVGVVLTVFALTGGNEGFAILWILLVPMFSISLLGVGPGLMVSSYFLVFLAVLFLTPLSASVADKYSSSFITRFPVLYLFDYAISTYFSLQRVYYHRKLARQAYTDGLTGLYNRLYFMEKLHELGLHSRYSVMMVDLNGLKTVNDELGHEAGDDYLCRVAGLITEEFADSAVACRIGGDEIAALSFDRPEVLEGKIGRLMGAAQKMNGTLGYDFSVSVGAAHNTEDHEALPEELMKLADRNMYTRKMAYYQDESHNRRKR